MDEQEGPRVKVALFGNDAEKEFTIGDVLEITNTYKYKDLATLSTKQTSKIEVSLNSLLKGLSTIMKCTRYKFLYTAPFVIIVSKCS